MSPNRATAAEPGAPLTDIHPIEPAVALPATGRRLWRTRFRRARPLDRIAPPLTAAHTAPDDAELSRYGRVLQLEDLVVAQHRDGTITTRTHLVAWLQGPEQLAEWDNQTWAFNPRYHRVTVHHARAGIPGSPMADAEQVVAPYMHAPGVVDAHAKVVNLKFPGLVPGVAVDVCIQEDFYTVDPGMAAMWREFYLNTAEPALRRRIVFAVAAPYDLRYTVHHADDAPTQSVNGDYQLWTWDLHDRAAMAPDAWTPPPRDYVPWVDASTLPGWTPVVDQLRAELVPPPADRSLRALFTELTEGAADDRERVAKIYAYATREVRYGRHPDHAFDRNQRTLDAVVRDLRGDCKDKSALMVSLLRELDVDARLAVLMTADYGRAPFLPSMRFNHAIVRATVDGDELWMDPASDVFAFGTQPYVNDGVPALLLGGDAPEITRTPMSTPAQHGTRRVCHGRLEDDGTYTFRAEAVLHGELGAALRMQLQGALPHEREQVISRWLLESLAGADVSEVTTSDIDDLTGPLELAYTLRIERLARRVKDIWLLRVPWDPPLTSSGPLTAATRDAHLTAPPPRLLTDVHSIALPDDFTGYGLPLEVRRESFGGVYELDARCEDGVVSCRRRVEHRGGIIAPAQYPEFRGWWSECARDDACDLVFVRGAI